MDAVGQARAEPWADAMLERPRAWPTIALRGCLRAAPSDFVVEERLAFEPTGAGQHRFLLVEKCLANTESVARDLARHYAVLPIAVSFAGRKDRRAIARQWFSVDTPRDDDPAPTSEFRVLRATRHARKLRRGELEHNGFSIRLTALEGDLEVLDARLAMIAEHGFPNYFGEQRFGRGGANIARARAWLGARRRRDVSAFEKGLHLSVGRSLLFNAVLAARVRADAWRAILPGDVEIDGAPTGPLWGRGRSPSTDRAGAIEASALVPFADWRDALEHAGLRQDRRALVARPRNLRWARSGREARVDFELGPGCFATQLLSELGTLTSPTTDECPP